MLLTMLTMVQVSCGSSKENLWTCLWLVIRA
jgi:hypothetical protein